MVKRIHMIMIGKVQGVFFRAIARDEARTLGLKGFVRNLPDGSVELEAEGDEVALTTLLHWAAHGPPGARVENVDVTWKSSSNDFEDFRITS